MMLLRALSAPLKEGHSFMIARQVCLIELYRTKSKARGLQIKSNEREEVSCSIVWSNNEPDKNQSQGKSRRNA